MKNITLNLPIQYINALQFLIDLGVYPSRSEAIRTAIREHLYIDLEFYDNIEYEKFRDLIRGV